MASEGRAASRPIHRRSVPSPESAGKELRRATDKRPRSSRLIVRLHQLASAFLGLAIAWDFVHRPAYSRFPSENPIRLGTARKCAPELRLTRMEFLAAGLLHPQHERRLS